MHKGRMEAFSDGVLAIIITIMVLELKVPHGADIESLKPLFPVFLSYIISFIYIGIYWNNHHHVMQSVNKIKGRDLWANLHLLFWLSIVPFVTSWMGENHFAALPVALYGCVLLMAGVAYYILTRSLVAHHGKNSTLAAAIGKDTKGLGSLAIYAVTIVTAFWKPAVAGLLYVVVALIWLIPDRRIENIIEHDGFPKE